MKIAFNNVDTRALRYKEQILSGFSSVLTSGRFFNGKQTTILVQKLERYFRNGYVTPVASGHDSLLIALQTLGCGLGDEVIIPANVYPTAFPVALSGAKPVLVDVDKNGLIDLDKVKSAVTNRTKAIIPVHLYGLVVDIHRLKEIIQDKSISIIEDCAQAFGSLYKDRPVGTYGDIGCFSFYPTKNIGTLGDGGALWTNNKKYHDFLNAAVSYGEKDKYKSIFVSGHSRLPELQAAVLNVYLQHFSEEKKLKKKFLAEYIDHFSHMNKVRLLYHENNSDPLVHLVVVSVQNRDRLRAYLAEKGIPTLIQYPHPIHHVKAFTNLKYPESSFPESERLSRSILSLPFHSSITKKQINYIVRNIHEFYE